VADLQGFIDNVNLAVENMLRV